jgi:hypothetical protein
VENCVLNKQMPDGTTVTVVLYVDDLLVTSEINGHIVGLKNHLLTKFPEVSYNSGKIVEYVGMTADFESKPGAAVITMKQITADIIETSGVLAKSPTPASSSLFELTPDDPRLSKEEESYYRTFVAKCLYLAKRVRPDILLPVAWLTTRVQVCTSRDLVKLHKVLAYIRSTPDRGITIEFGENPRTNAHIDASYAVHLKDGRSHTGGSITFGVGGPLYVTSVKQAIVTKSSTEAELIAFSDVCSEVIAINNFAIAQGYPSQPAMVYQDNMSAMALVDKGGPCSKRSRHIDIRDFWMTEQIAKGTIIMEHCPTAQMWANLLTKPLQGAQFVYERHHLTNWKE